MCCTQMNHNLDHAFVAPFTGSEPCSPAPLGGVVISCRQPINSPDGVFNMSNSTQHQEPVDQIKTTIQASETITPPLDEASTGVDQTTRPAIGRHISKQQSSPASVLSGEGESSQPEAVNVTASDGKLGSSPSPAKGGDDPIKSEGGVPGTADRADAQTLGTGDLRSGGLVDFLHDTLAGEREFIFKRHFPKAKFCPTPCWERDQQFKSNFDLQLNYLEHYDNGTQSLLKLIYRKVTLVLKNGEPGYWNNQTTWDNYKARACLIATSGYAKRTSFSLCGVRRRDCRNSSCQDITFCPRCNFNRRLGPMVQEFGHCYTTFPEVYFITLSLSKSGAREPRLTFKDLTAEVWYEEVVPDGCVRPFTDGLLTSSGWTDFDGFPAVFRAGRATLGATVDGKRLSGYFGAPEVAVGFLPFRVLPHVHALAFSHCYTMEDAQEVLRDYEDRLRVLRDKGVIPRTAVADVQILRVLSEEDYLNKLRYCFKPLKVEQAFQYSSTTRVGDDLAAMAKLSREVEEFFEVIEVAFLDFARVMRKGVCAPKAAAYCGVVTPERQFKRDREQARRTMAKRRKASAARRLREDEG